MNTFTTGEKVVLTTNPILQLVTVLKVNDNGTYHCQYEDKRHEVKTSDFSASLLRKYVDPTVVYRL